uniref:Uncharacterized protein n=1 Tax=Lactuca sativa TaxID=4236 RepID=A0A9R1VGD1_LACSA|nr:hypothetical protein LSAT_V11C500263550 [Lactuca sativa]
MDSLGGYKWKSFLDAYEVYHQVKMATLNEDKTSFYTEKDYGMQERRIKDWLRLQKHEAKSKKMCVQVTERKVLRLCCNHIGNRGEFIERRRN